MLIISFSQFDWKGSNRIKNNSDNWGVASFNSVQSETHTELFCLCLILFSFILSIASFYIGTKEIWAWLFLFYSYFIILVFFISWFLGLSQKHPVFIYLILPIPGIFVTSGLMYMFFKDDMYFHENDPNMLLVFYLIGIFITSYVYVHALPMSTVRDLKGRTTILAPVTTIFIQLLSQSNSVIFTLMAGNNIQKLSPQAIKNSTELTKSMKKVFLNPVVFDFLNYYTIQKQFDEFMNQFSFIIFSLTITYILCGILIEFKVKKGDSVARNLWYDINLSDRTPDKRELENCIYYGGDHFKDMIIGNKELSRIYKTKDKDVSEILNQM